MRYSFKSEIARGGMGRIVAAHDRELDRNVAMKLLLREHAMDGGLVERFLDEARATARLQHPNIVPIYEMGVNAAGEPFFAMRLVRGQTLAVIIRKLREGDALAHAKFGLVRRLQLALQICDAVAYAHARHVLHRDLKLANVMVGEFGEVVVMDWGLAKRLRTPAAQRTGGRASRAPEMDTADGIVLGTPSYMPPEQAGGRLGDVDEKSDVYSIGAIMYELLVLRPPHTGDTPVQVLASVLKTDPPEP